MEKGNGANLRLHHGERDSFMPSKGGSCSLYSMVIKEYSFKSPCSLFLTNKFLTVQQKKKNSDLNEHHRKRLDSGDLQSKRSEKDKKKSKNPKTELHML